MLSIVTVCWNDLQGLKATAESLRSQTDREFEWVVVDGGSTDGTVEYLKGCDTVASYTSERDGGIYDAMRRGLLRVHGEYVWFLNAGDVACDSNVVSMITRSMRPDIDIAFFAVYLMFPRNVSRLRLARDPGRAIQYGVPGNQQGTIYRREILSPSLFLHDYRICGDYYLAAVLISSGARSAVFENPIANFFLGGVSTHRITSLAREAYAIQKEVLKLSEFRARLFMVRRLIVGWLTRSMYFGLK